MKISQAAFCQGVADIMAFRPLRWWLFRRLSSLGWWICPEPHKSHLQSVMPTWRQVESSPNPLQEQIANIGKEAE
jgi:hypothetical protein